MNQTFDWSLVQSFLAALDQGIYDPAATHTILRAGGPADYFEIIPETRFKMRRPRTGD